MGNRCVKGMVVALALGVSGIAAIGAHEEEVMDTITSKLIP